MKVRKHKSKEQKVQKVQKVNRKDVFKKIKKTKEPMLVAPEFLNAAYKVSKVTDSGIFQDSNDSFNKLYALDIEDRDKFDISEIFMVLRNYNARLKLLNPEKDDFYLFLQIKSKNMAEAVEDYKLLEIDMIAKMFVYGLDVKAIEFNDRMRLIHRLVLIGYQDQSLNIINYYDAILNWKNDFLLEKYKEESEKHLASEQSFYEMAYIRRFPKDILSVSKVMTELRKFAEIKYIYYDFEPVDDRAITCFLDNNYLGVDAVFDKTKRTGNTLKIYDIYKEGINHENKNQYTMCGISFVISVDEIGDFERIEKSIAEMMKKNSISCEYYFYDLKRIFSGFLPLNFESDSQLRLLENDKAVNLLFKENSKRDMDLDSLIIEDGGQFYGLKENEENSSNKMIVKEEDLDLILFYESAYENDIAIKELV